ncbi:MAG: choice-of-anchor D domain-containing protein, partial [Candidatus Acidiferrales bacterium]
ANIESQNNNGTVEVNGVDTAQPTTPFEFTWGDGNTTSGFFPQEHSYTNVSQNYVITITATENNGSSQKYSVPLFFVDPTVAAESFPGISFQIPSAPVEFQSHWTGYTPPTDVTEFPNSSFPLYSRTAMTNILRGVSSIDYTFANKNSFLSNRQFSIDMLEGTNYSGGVSYWFTTPMSVGYGASTLNAPIAWYILFNELGKDTTLNTPSSLTYGGHTDGDASEIYSETMGDIFAYASGCQLVSNPSAYGLGPVATADIRNNMFGGAILLQQTYSNYVAAGAPFSSWNPNNGQPDPTLGTISTLAWKFIEHAEQQGKGYQVPAQRMMKLLQLFDSSMLTSYAPTENTEAAATFRSTLMVTALSYAFSQDLRSEFESLNFPIDNYAFEQLYEMATAGGAKLSPTSESFGSVAVGSTSTGKTITLTNSLLTPLTISVSFSGSDPKDFPIQSSSTCPHPGGTLAANSSCTYVIAFKPSIRGAESAKLSVTETAQDISQALPSSPQSAALSGMGRN